MRKKIISRSISWLILTFLIMTSSFVYGETESMAIRMQINNTLVTTMAWTEILDVPPTIINGQTMLPLDFIGEKLGLEVIWDSSTQMITLKNSERYQEFVLFIGKNEMRVGPNTKLLWTPPIIVKGTILVPARVIAEATWAKVEWNAQTKELTITPNWAEELPVSTTQPVVIKSSKGSMGKLPDGKVIMSELYGEKTTNKILNSALKELKKYPVVCDGVNGKPVDVSSMDKYNAWLDTRIAKDPKSKATYEYYRYKKTPIKTITFLGKSLKVEPNDFAYTNAGGTMGVLPVSYMQKCIDSNSLNNPKRGYEKIYSISKPFRWIISIEMGENNLPYSTSSIKIWAEGCQGYFLYYGGETTSYEQWGGTGPMYDKDGNAFIGPGAICRTQAVITGVVLNRKPID